MILRLLLSFMLTTLSAPVLADTFVVEMKTPLCPIKKKLLSEAGAKKIELFDNIDLEYFKRTYRIEVDKKETLYKFDFVKKVEIIHPVELLNLRPARRSERLTNDPLFPFQWGLYNQEQIVFKEIDDINSLAVKGQKGQDLGWNKLVTQIDSQMNRDVVVAVVDSGVDITHPDLKGKFVKNFDECDENGLPPVDKDWEDKDENELPGDCVGWNFTRPIDNIAARFVTDEIGHGTHVAGIIAANSNNRIGISSISNKIKILPVKVMGASDANGGQRISMSDRLARGILYAVKKKVDVINLSLGWPRSIDTNYLRQTIASAVSAGITVVAAAGNNSANTNIFPCAYHHVVCVGAIQNDGKIATFSNYGGNVDVLAPGDTILSTYPQTFTPVLFPVIGYDYKNGTSQAAPHVSAAAAVLKGVFPELKEDELKARLFNSAGDVPKDELKGKTFLHGAVNLRKALEKELEPTVRPVFKDLTQVAYFEESKLTSFDLRIKNFWGVAEKVLVEITSLVDHFQINRKEYVFENLPAGQAPLIKVRGKLLDSLKDRRYKFSVKITVNEKVQGNFVHEIPAVRVLRRDPDVINRLVRIRDPKHVLATMTRGKIHSNLGTVTDIFKTSALPEYFLRRVAAEEVNKGIHLYLFRVGKDVIFELPNNLFIADAKEILNFFRLDFNYDGKPDYLVRAVVEKDGKQHILYSFFDQDLNPLYGDKSEWKFRPETVVMNPKTVKFVPFELEGLGKVAIPLFNDIGKIPEADLVTDVWSRPDRSVLSRIYYLEPKVEDGEVNLKTRIIDNKNFLDKLKKDLNLYWNDSVAVIGNLHQSEDDFKRGTVRTFISIGRGFLRSDYLLSIKSVDEVEVTPMNINGLRLERDILFPLTDLSGKRPKIQYGNTFVSFRSENTLRISHIRFKGDAQTDKAYAVEHKQEILTDSILGFIASFKKNESEYSFMQSKSNLIVVKSEEGSQSALTYPINRFSFLPGNILNDVFYPISITNEDELFPALYIDSTQISRNTIHAVMAKEESLLSPSRYSVLVPANCQALNPAPMNRKGGHGYVMLCLFDVEDKKQWGLKFVNL